MTFSWRREGDEFEISTDNTRLDVPAVHAFLTASYWAKGIPLPVVERSVRNSICFGIYRGHEQVGFARVVSDRATFAYLADVYVLPGFRGRGLAKWLMECIMAHPDLQGLRRWSLLTRDAHRLYQAFGFEPLHAPERWMEKHDPDVYARIPSGGVP
ncbi:MAG TPA: GNAT family N-acetyltransferase [Candidatus Angelobacter sp.]|nr:GNAT family N-acetyltransferase [Candidatus Angelobacter sp.]